MVQAIASAKYILHCSLSSSYRVRYFKCSCRAYVQQTRQAQIITFRFFNQYAGQRDPATATGAFCILRDVLDIADTDRFPESEFGKQEGGINGKNKEIMQPIVQWMMATKQKK
ncbi:MAG: hypothetical protein WKF59_08120 [Chitinophagaceae bacterium]